MALLLIPSCAFGGRGSRTADTTAIMDAMENWNRGWREKDVALATQDYEDQIDWTNAFGHRVQSRRELESLLREIFGYPFVMAGRSKTDYAEIRFLKPRVALVRSRNIREGQKLSDGTPLPTRYTNHLRVFEKRGGQWKIVSHLIGDERALDGRQSVEH